MDCDRANRRYRAVEKDFLMLEESEPTAEVLVEGRIVMASALADQSDVRRSDWNYWNRARAAPKQLRNPSFRHVRLSGTRWLTSMTGPVTWVWLANFLLRVVLAEPEAYDAARSG